MKKTIAITLLLAALSLASCGTKSSSSESGTSASAVASEASSEAAPEAGETTAAPAEEETTERVTAPQQEVGYEGMEAVAADALKEGEYDISVDSSSSMFKIAGCKLYVKDGAMTADVLIDSKSYDALFMGTEEAAGEADASERITYTTNESGQSVFRVPVEALDKEILCAALSAKKQEWYGRTLVFRADSLPEEAFAESRYRTAADLGLEDGEYTAEVTLEGGSGRASVESPAAIKVEGGAVSAIIKWRSDKYDKMEVGGETYLPEIKDGRSVFTIPVAGFGYKVPVGAETTAMSQPHMIDYTLYFDPDTIKKCE